MEKINETKILAASIAAVLLVVIVVALAFQVVGIVKIEGNEVFVIQDWQKGVLDRVLMSGTKFYPNWAWDLYEYNIGTQKITFDDPKTNQDAEYDRIQVEIGEGGGQRAWVAISANYRVGWREDQNKKLVFDPTLVVSLHNDGIGKTYESVVLKRTVIEVINEIARPKLALDIYSGKGFVAFANEVDVMLKNHPQLKDRGIYIENTIIYKVYLDPQYEAEIAKKQIAQQQVLRKQQETLAANEEAKRVSAEEQAKVERVTQTANAEKIKQIKAAEAQAAQEVLKAGAEKQKRVLEAEGDRDANLAKASGVLAVGQAEAQVAQLKSTALYAGEAGLRRAEVEIATKRAEMMKELANKITILPEKTFAQIGKAGGVLVSQTGGGDE